MTNQEIWERQQAARKAAEGRRTIGARLREAANVAPEAEARGLLAEAADAIEYYERAIAGYRQDLRDEQREAQRAAGEAFVEGRHEGLDEARGGY